jgi:hypothetical protein
MQRSAQIGELTLTERPCRILYLKNTLLLVETPQSFKGTSNGLETLYIQAEIGIWALENLEAIFSLLSLRTNSLYVMECI